MKIISKRGAFQGDLLLRPVGALPANAVMRPRDGRLIVGHSETGHHHAIDEMKVAHFEVPGDPLVCYLQLDDASCDVVHHRSWDTHETARLTRRVSRVWEVRRQRERAPEGWRRVAD